jgi:cytochrome P450
MSQWGTRRRGEAPSWGKRHVQGTIDLYRPETYGDGPPHEVFAELRASDPVVWQDIPGQEGYWAVLRHADVVHVSRNPLLFSAEAGGVVLETLDEERLVRMRNMLLAMDPPRHIAYRKPLAPEFRARIIAGMEDRIRSITRTILDRIEPGSVVDVCHEVCGPLPSQVIGELFGLPRDDWDHIHDLAERITHGQDPDVNPDGQADDGADASMEMAMYGIAFAGARRRTEPQGDLMDVILGSEFDGRLLTDLDIGSLFAQMVIAGNDTTVTMLSSGLLTLVEHPDQLAELRSDPQLVPGAVEEILRYANPLHYFRRTATEDTVLGHTAIAAGDKVAMYYTSANRDEDVFSDPQRFDIHREPNPHLSFGIGEHFCLGVHLARLEGRVFFEEVLARFPSIESAGTPVRTRSNLNNAYRQIPLRLA